MAIAFSISDSLNLISNQSTTLAPVNISNMGGIGSWIAVPFMAKKNITLNTFSFRTATVVAGTLITYLAGIGTIDITTGFPSVGVGNSLNFTSASSINGVGSGATVFGNFSNINLTQGVKYFLGFQVVDRSATGNIQYQTHIMNGQFDDTSNYKISTFNSSGLSYQRSVLGSTFNWGYDSGVGNSIWYNELYGASTALISSYSLFSSTGVSQNGFTFYLNSDFNALELEEVSVMARNTNITPSSGSGVTYRCILYDSDGITALTASTQSYFGSAINVFRKVFMPIKYTLLNKKLYYFAFNQESTNNSNDFLLAMIFPNQFLAGASVTSYAFRKIDATSTPTLVVNEMLVFDLVFSKAYGSRQGGPGNY